MLAIRRTLLSLTLSGAAAAQCEPALEVQGLTSLCQFGFSAAVTGEWGLVGAPGDSTVAFKAGAVYPYEYVAGAWIPRDALLASDGLQKDQLGTSVAASGPWVAVGAPGAPADGYRRGAVYMFHRTAGIYTEVNKLLAADRQDSDEFGYSLALDGNRLLVGARFGDAPGVDNCGAAYVFEFAGGVWSQVAKLVASDPAPSDYFSQELDLSGDVAAIGAWGDDDFGTGTGAVYTFRASLGWTQEQKLHTHDAEVGDFIGYDVSVDGDALVVGVPGWDGNLTNQGAAFVFRYSTSWTQSQYLPGVHDDGEFGHSVALDGGLLAVTAVKGKGLTAGSGDGAYLIDNGGAFAFAGRLLAFDGEGQDRYGEAVALDGVHVLIGAPEEDGAGSSSGATYGYDLPFADANLDGISDDCAPGITVFCPCGTPPCGASSPFGCVNSTGQGGQLAHLTGSVSVAADDLILRASQLPPLQFGLLFMGPGTVDPTPLGDGMRCVGAPLYRYAASATGNAGRFDLGPGLIAFGEQSFSHLGQVVVGQTWFFQGWYRSPGGPCGGGSNLTNALAVTFQL